MARFLKDRQAALGKAPGSLVFIGSKKVSQPKAQSIAFSQAQVVEDQDVDLSALPEPGSTDQLMWLNVVGVHDKELIRRIGDTYKLHDLVLEGIMNTGLRPRVEEFEGCLFFALKMIRFEEEEEVIISEQISIVLMPGLVITFQENERDVFEPVRNRIRNNIGRVRRQKADYLTFALLDLVFDHYISAVEKLGDHIEELESEILENPDQELLEHINQFKREINFLRKHIRPARELTSQFAKLESPLIQKGTRQFLKELIASASQAAEVVDTYGSMLTDFLQVYHTSVSTKTNEVMKVLTIFAAIFIPLTFLAGIYGMNFEHMPELSFKYSYPIFWGGILTAGFWMVRYFRKKGWF